MSGLAEKLAEGMCLIAPSGRLALRCHDGSLIDPLIGEPYATLVRASIAELVRQALDEAARVARVWGLPPAISDTAALQREIAAAIEAMK